MTRRMTIGLGVVLLLVVGLLLTACGSPDTTPEAGFAQSAASPDVVEDVASPTATATPSPTPTAAATPEGTPAPLSQLAYLLSFSRIADRQVQLARADLTLMASGADDAALAAQLQTELPERQQLLDDLKKLNPPDEFESLHANLVESYQEQLDAQQQLIQGTQSGDQSLIDRASEAMTNNQLTQSFCASSSPEQELGAEDFLNQIGGGTPIATPALPDEVLTYIDSTNEVENDMARNYRTLCPFLPHVAKNKSAYAAQLKQILPAISKDVDALSQVDPPDAFSEYHEELVAGYQKLLESQQLEVQGYEQNDNAITKQGRVAQAQGQLKLLDAQAALQSALMNEMTGP